MQITEINTKLKNELCYKYSIVIQFECNQQKLIYLFICNQHIFTFRYDEREWSLISFWKWCVRCFFLDKFQAVLSEVERHFEQFKWFSTFQNAQYTNRVSGKMKSFFPVIHIDELRDKEFISRVCSIPASMALKMLEFTPVKHWRPVGTIRPLRTIPTHNTQY